MDAPDLSDAQAFAAVAQARSFRGAAAARGVSASSLSEALRRLEGRLGVRLLNRTTRSVTPTEAGRALLDRLAPALAEVAAAFDAVNEGSASPTGTLRLNVPSVVADFVLPALLARFLQTQPGVTVEVAADDGFVDVLAAGFDAGVRYDERLARDMIAVPLGARVERFALAAAPAYLARRGRPAHPHDLLDHACIRHRFPDRALSPWEFERDGETVRVDPKPRLVATTIELGRAAAIEGLGVVAMFEAVLAPAVEAGHLDWLMRDWWPSFSGPFLYYPSRRHVPAPLRAFVDFLKRERTG